METGSFTDAFNSYREIYARAQEPFLLYLIAYCLLATGENFQARSFYEILASSEGDGLPRLYAKAAFHILAGEVDEALICWHEIARQDPAERVAVRLIDEIKKNRGPRKFKFATEWTAHYLPLPLLDKPEREPGIVSQHGRPVSAGFRDVRGVSSTDYSSQQFISPSDSYLDTPAELIEGLFSEESKAATAPHKQPASGVRAATVDSDILSETTGATKAEVPLTNTETPVVPGDSANKPDKRADHPTVEPVVEPAETPGAVKLAATIRDDIRISPANAESPSDKRIQPPEKSEKNIAVADSPEPEALSETDIAPRSAGSGKQVNLRLLGILAGILLSLLAWQIWRRSPNAAPDLPIGKNGPYPGIPDQYHLAAKSPQKPLFEYAQVPELQADFSVIPFLINEGKWNRARYLLRKILHSNADFKIRDRALQFLENLPIPTYAEYREDLRPEDIAQSPALSEGATIRWRGAVQDRKSPTIFSVALGDGYLALVQSPQPFNAPRGRQIELFGEFRSMPAPNRFAIEAREIKQLR